MNKNLVAIFEYLEKEKGLKRELIVDSIEEALLAAANKGLQSANVKVNVDPKTGEITSIAAKEVVDVVNYPSEEILLHEAKELDPNAQMGDFVDVEVFPENFGRIAAQLARQMISQKLKGAEREVIYEEYRHRVGELVSGTVRRVAKENTLIIDLGRVEGLLPSRFYPKTETYRVGERVLALLFEVQDTETGGAEVILSRSHPEFVAALFKQEVPELEEEVVSIKKIVRDPGLRTKIAVSSTDAKIDAVGACVGMRGSRIKNVLRELNTEKIDVIPYSDDPFVLLKNSLSPTEIKVVEYNEEEDLIVLVAADDDYPAVLGKKGSNARLTSSLIGLQIKIHKFSEYQKELTVSRRQLALSEDPALDEVLTKVENVNQLVFDTVISSGLDTPRKLLQKTPQEISKMANLSLQMSDDLLNNLSIQIKKKMQGI